MSTPAPKIDQLVAKYVELRDLKAAMKKEYENKVEPVQAALDRIEAHLLKTMADQGSNAIKTSAGTAFIAEKTSATMADWDMFIAYVREHELWNLLNHAANKTGVQEFIAANDNLPPGVTWRVEQAVNIRRA